MEKWKESEILHWTSTKVDHKPAYKLYRLIDCTIISLKYFKEIIDMIANWETFSLIVLGASGHSQSDKGAEVCGLESEPSLV